MELNLTKNLPGSESSSASTAVRSNFDLEPNPFEQSFASKATSGNSSPGNTLTSSVPLSSATQSNIVSTPGGRRHVLPPVAQLTSPAGLLGNNTPTPGASWVNSLRSGPLSPAMLAGPQNINGVATSITNNLVATATTGAFNMRGVIPATDGIRTGLTPGGSGSMFPTPGPATAALLGLNGDSMIPTSGIVTGGSTVLNVPERIHKHGPNNTIVAGNMGQYHSSHLQQHQQQQKQHQHHQQALPPQQQKQQQPLPPPPPPQQQQQQQHRSHAQQSPVQQSHLLPTPLGPESNQQPNFMSFQQKQGDFHQWDNTLNPAKSPQRNQKSPQVNHQKQSQPPLPPQQQQQQQQQVPQVQNQSYMTQLQARQGGGSGTALVSNNTSSIQKDGHPLPNASHDEQQRELDRQRIRQIFDEAASIPIRLQDFTEQLSPDDKRQVQDLTRSIFHMYQRIDQLVPMFYVITKNTNATRRLIQLKFMYKEQMEALQKGVYLTTPQVLDKTKHEINRYFLFVRDNLQQSTRTQGQNGQGQINSQNIGVQGSIPPGSQGMQSSQRGQPQVSSGQSNTVPHGQYNTMVQQPLNTQQRAAVMNQRRQILAQQQQQQQLGQQHQQVSGHGEHPSGQPLTTIPGQVPPVQAFSNQPDALNQMFNPALNADVYNSNNAMGFISSSSPGFNNSTSQQFNNGQHLQTLRTQQQQQQPMMQVQQPFVQAPQHNQQPQSHTIAQAPVKKDPTSRKRNAKQQSSPANTQQIAQHQSPLVNNNITGVSSPSPLLAYNKAGLTAEQLKLPVNKKRKTSGSPQMATPGMDEKMVITPKSLSSPIDKKSDIIKQERVPSANASLIDKKALQKSARNAQKMKELSMTQPLTYFITALGEALDIPEDDVNQGILVLRGKPYTNGDSSKANAATKTGSSGGGKDMTPSALLRTPLPFSAAKTPHSMVKSVGPSSAGPEDTSEKSIMNGLPLTPPWSGSVPAVAINNAFGAVEAVKSVDMQFLTPPEEFDEIKDIKKDKKSIKEGNLNADYITSSDVEMKEDLHIHGLDDVNVWNYDAVITSVGNNEDALRKEFWTLST